MSLNWVNEGAGAMFSGLMMRSVKCLGVARGVWVGALLLICLAGALGGPKVFRAIRSGGGGGTEGTSGRILVTGDRFDKTAPGTAKNEWKPERSPIRTSVISDGSTVTVSGAMGVTTASLAALKAARAASAKQANSAVKKDVKDSTDTANDVKLIVQVVWENREPVAGVGVTCDPVRPGAIPDDQPPAPTGRFQYAVSDAAGNAFFDMPKDSLQVCIGATSENSVPVYRNFFVSATRPLVLTLQRGYSVFGTVYTEENGVRKPAAGATVTLGYLPLEHPPTAIAAADGTYKLTGISKGEVELEASLGALRAPARRDEHQVIRFAAAAGAADGPHDLVLRPGASLVGMVVDKETGKGIAGARVRAFHDSNPQTTLEFDYWDEHQDAVTANDGSFAFEGLPAGRIKLRALADKHGDVVKFAEVKPGPDNNVLLELGGGGVLHVKGVDLDGAPVDGAWLNVSRAGGWYVEEFTDVNGYLTLQGVRWDVPYSIWLWAYATGSEGKDITLKRGEDSTSVTMKFNFRNSDRKKVKVIVGTVTDEAGQAVRGATLYCQQGWAVARDAVGPMFTTDATGAYRIEHWGEDGGFYVSVSSAGHAPAWANAQFGSEDAPARMNFVLQKANWLEGRVLDDAGQGLAGVSVRAYPMNAGPFSTAGHPGMRDVTTLADGRFRLENLTGPQVTLKWKKADWMMTPAVMPPVNVNAEVEIKMTRGGEIVGRVLEGATGNPVGAFVVKVSAASGTQIPGDAARQAAGQQFFGPDGRFRIGGLVAGDNYLVTVTPPVGALGAANVEARATAVMSGGARGDGIVVKLNPAGVATPGGIAGRGGE